MRQKKILFVASEAAPFARIGGLGSVMYSLPRALQSLGHDVRLFLPRYIHIDSEKYSLTTEVEGLKVPTDNNEGQPSLTCNVKKFKGNGGKDPVTTYFLENQEYFEQRANVYGYSDDHTRWALLSRGALEFIHTTQNWTPDVIVSSDWMAGLLPNYLKNKYSESPALSNTASVFSIHNMFYQGMFDHRFVQEMDYDDGHSPVPGLHHERLPKINSLRRGIMYADMINTVSPTYSREIMTEQCGEGLHPLLRERKAVVTGILNGIDHQKWNPAKDPLIKNPFSIRNLKNRSENKAALQERFNLPKDENAFIACIVSRLDGQKGLDLLNPIMDTLLHEIPMQMIVVGEGDTNTMAFFKHLETKYPKQVATHLKFDSVLPHEVFAGSDVVLIPSRFEPSGLTQMEAMRYGTIPIVRKTGGLADTVENYDPENNAGTGFVFENADSSSLLVTIIRAFETFRHKKSWSALQRRAMAKDFSWERSAKKYDKMFSQAIELRARACKQPQTHGVD